VVERANSWHNRGFKKLQVCTERRTRVIDALIALANAIIIVRRLIRRAWTTHRWHNAIGSWRRIPNRLVQWRPEATTPPSRPGMCSSTTVEPGVPDGEGLEAGQGSWLDPSTITDGRPLPRALPNMGCVLWTADTSSNATTTSICAGHRPGGAPAGIEPATPSLPWNDSGNWSQPTATVFACLSRFGGHPICRRLRRVATAGLHKGSILRCPCWLRGTRARALPVRRGSGIGGGGSMVAAARATVSRTPRRRIKKGE
jgi:hypothetical protein